MVEAHEQTLIIVLKSLVTLFRSMLDELVSVSSAVMDVTLSEDLSSIFVFSALICGGVTLELYQTSLGGYIELFEGRNQRE